MPNGKPNILVIWGDDIGISNLSCYSDGLMGYRTPNIDRIAAEGVRFTDYYGEQSCTAGRVGVHHRPEPVSHRAQQGGYAGRRHRPPGTRPDDRHGAEGPGLCHRPVRQEPPRRQGRVPADDARLRRVLRQPLPPQRRGGAGTRGLPERGGVPGLPQELRSSRCHPLVGQRRRHPAHRGHGTAHQGADEDHRRGAPARGAAFHGRCQGQRHAVLPVVQHHAHALPHPHQGRQPWQGWTLAVGVPRRDVRPRRARRSDPRLSRRQRPCR